MSATGCFQGFETSFSGTSEMGVMDLLLPDGCIILALDRTVEPVTATAVCILKKSGSKCREKLQPVNCSGFGQCGTGNDLWNYCTIFVQSDHSVKWLRQKRDTADRFAEPLHSKQSISIIILLMARNLHLSSTGVIYTPTSIDSKITTCQPVNWSEWIAQCKLVGISWHKGTQGITSLSTGFCLQQAVICLWF